MGNPDKSNSWTENEGKLPANLFSQVLIFIAIRLQGSRRMRTKMILLVGALIAMALGIAFTLAADTSQNVVNVSGYPKDWYYKSGFHGADDENEEDIGGLWLVGTFR